VDALLRTAWTPRMKEVLAEALTVGETYFFRDRALFDLLAREELPRLLLRAAKEGRPLRIWSAGCSSGEEPYSLAMVLEDLPDAHKTFLLATDINPAFLEKAMEGVYGDWSFRESPPGIKERFFAREGNRYILAPRIRRKVRFQLLNLAEACYPSVLTHTTHLDLILCRNVLMYLAPETGAAILRRFHEALVEGGTLILGPSETFLADKAGFRFDYRDGCIFLMKPPAMPPAPAPLPHRSRIPAAGVGKEVPSDPGEVTSRERFEPHLRARGADGARAAPAGPPAADWDGVPGMARLARSLADQGRLTDALYWSDQASAIRPDPSVEFLRAATLLELDNPQAAERLLRRVLFLDPGHIPARLELGNLASGRGDAAEAERQYRTALLALRDLPEEEVLPDSGGVTAGTLLGLVEAFFRESGTAHG
jgi:chemotaxis protein methyltransferase CheR